MKRKLSTYFKGYILGLCIAFLLFTFILKINYRKYHWNNNWNWNCIFTDLPI